MAKKSSKKKVTKAAPVEAPLEPVVPDAAEVSHAEAPEAEAPAAAEPTPTPEAPGEPASPKRRKKDKPAQPKKLSAIDAAAQVLVEAGQPMTTAELIDAMARKKLWSSPNGQTPAATLCSAILREIAKKGDEARFVKTERGKFAAAR